MQYDLHSEMSLFVESRTSVFVVRVSNVEKRHSSFSQTRVINSTQGQCACLVELQKQESVAVELKTQDEAEQQCAQNSLFKIISTLQFLPISKGYFALQYLANEGSKVVT